MRRLWMDGELGGRAALIPVLLLWLPFFVAPHWSFILDKAIVLNIAMAAVLVYQGVRVLTRGRDFTCAPMEGAGSALVLALGMMVLEFILVGFTALSDNLAPMAADGLEAPKWLTDYHWAKPALMIMGLWGAIGSNNMLLYLAALTNIPQELYEAADIDGAGRLQRFWHVTWPQLAPTTFFIAVMATIHGLQGGFEMARTMTQGGPAGATTTLSYFIYTEGFETGRLSFAAATAWVLFILVFSLTLFNWRFGNKYVND
jgi:multiple sugar transport system permease protein